MNSRKIGQQAEQFVADYLQRQDKNILAYNYQKMCGEIDIIATDNKAIYFVEVKVRKNPVFPLEELVPAYKQRKIIKTAQHYLALSNFTNKVCQFDVALVELRENNYHITYIPNAFTPTDLSD